LTNKAKREKINEIIECQEGIKMASDVLSTISKDWYELCRRRSEEKYELDLQSEIVYAKHQGMLISDEKWKDVVAEEDAEIEQLRAQIAELQK